MNEEKLSFRERARRWEEIKDKKIKLKRLEHMIHSLDWMDILKEAIESRPTSWKKYAVREWRNASDEILFSFLKHLKQELYDSLKEEDD